VIVNTQNHSKQYAAKSAKEVNLDMERKLEDTNLEQRMLGQSEILRALSVPHVHVSRFDLTQRNHHLISSWIRIKLLSKQSLCQNSGRKHKIIR